jgi:Rrf2 family protein
LIVDIWYQGFVRMNAGVEWAIHCCVDLALTGPELAVSAARFAARYDLPAAYLNKQLQALVRAGILTSTPGPRGGFRLARRPSRISLLDVVVAIEGADDAFQCTQILNAVPGADPSVDYQKYCLVSKAMRSAELVYRRELRAQTIAHLKAAVEHRTPDAPTLTRRSLTT